MLENSKRLKSFLLEVALVGGLLFFSGCKSTKEDKVGANGDRGSRGDQSLPGDNVSNCSGIEAIEILQDGNTVVSRVSENSWVAWEIDNRKVKARGLSLNYFAASSDGSYLLSRVSHRKYQLLALFEGSYRQKTVIAISSAKKASMRFSRDSKHIIIQHRPYNSRGLDRFDLYDIEKGKFLKSFKAAGIKSVRLADAGRSIVMGYDNGFDKYIAKYNLESFEQIFRINLPRYRSFNYMETTAERIVAKSKNTYFVYSLGTGELLYQNDYKHIYEVDEASGLALAAIGWGEIAVVDLNDGEQVFAGSSPQNVILSSCRLKTEPLRLACRERVEQNKISVWEAQSGESVLTCY